jgi:hypothetical protein
MPMSLRILFAGRRTLALALVALLCAGCIYVSRRDVTKKGPPLESGFVAAITDGTTMRAEVVSALGEPAEVHRLPDGGERLIYQSVTREETEKRVLFLMHSEEQQTSIRRLYLTVNEDGVVTGHRVEESAR